jgi:hypothetical protein
MGKLLEDSVGTFENVLIALTFLGVAYLVMQQAHISLFRKEGMAVQTAGVLGFNTEDDAANRAGYYPNSRGLEGFSDGAMEAPVFHATPFTPEDFNQVAFEQSASGVEYGDAAAGSAWAPAQQRSSGKEGMYGKAAKVRQGAMDRKLQAALTSGNVSL